MNRAQAMQRQRPVTRRPSRRSFWPGRDVNYVVLGGAPATYVINSSASIFAAVASYDPSGISCAYDNGSADDIGWLIQAGLGGQPRYAESTTDHRQITAPTAIFAGYTRAAMAWDGTNYQVALRDNVAVTNLYWATLSAVGVVTAGPTLKFASALGQLGLDAPAIAVRNSFAYWAFIDLRSTGMADVYWAKTDLSGNVKIAKVLITSNDGGPGGNMVNCRPVIAVDANEMSHVFWSASGNIVYARLNVTGDAPNVRTVVTVAPKTGLAGGIAGLAGAMASLDGYIYLIYYYQQYVYIGAVDNQGRLALPFQQIYVTPNGYYNPPIASAPLAACMRPTTEEIVFGWSDTSSVRQIVLLRK